MPVTVTISGVEETISAIQARLKERVIRAMNLLAIEAQRRVKAEKLSGPPSGKMPKGQVLRVQTGRLRRSITQRVDVQGERVVAIVGTNVEYARVHEFGADMDVRVRDYMRMAKVAWGKQMKNPHAVQVHAHTRHIKVPERSFLRSAIEDMQREGVIDATLDWAANSPDKPVNLGGK